MGDRLRELLGPESEDNGSSPMLQDEYLAAKCPILHALLSLTEWEGERRQPATLVLFCEDGRFKVTVNDKQKQRVAFVTLDSCEDVFEHLEGCLRDGKLDWRKSSRGRFQR